MSTVALAADHAGFELKQHLAAWLKGQGYEILDLGAHSYVPDDDYPDAARSLGNAVAAGHVTRGILICGSGVGVSIAANKIPGVRAAMCHDHYSAHQGVEHDDMNVLVMGARVVGQALAEELSLAFLHASFSGEPRHVRRLNKVKQIESEFQRG